MILGGTMSEDLRRRLLESSPEGPSLLDLWLSDQLPPDEHAACTELILADPELRAEAELRLVVDAGVRDSARAVRRFAGLAIGVRRVGEWLDTLAGALAPLQPAVALTRGPASAGAQVYPLDPWAPGARLHVRAAENGRFHLSVEPGDARATDWILSGDEVERVVPQHGTETVDLRTVESGEWTLRRASPGEPASTPLPLSLH